MAKKMILKKDLTDAFCILMGRRGVANPEAERLAELGFTGLLRKTLELQGRRKFNGRFPVKEEDQADDVSMNEYESRSNYEAVRTAMGAGFIASAAFSEALDQTMLALYEAAKPNWQRWANSCEVNHLVGTRLDFDPAETPSVVGAGQKYPPHSENNKSTNEISIEKRGRVLKISFEALFDADMGEIQRLLREEVAALVRAEDDEVIAALTTTSGFFTATNTFTGPLTEDNLSAAMTKLRQMKSNKVKLHYTPSALLIPSPLEQDAHKIIYDSDLDLEIVVESRLDDVSAVDWFLVADKQQSDSVVLQFLAGYRQPELRRLPRQLDFDGERYRIKHVCKAKATRGYAIIKGDA